jgi:hypothetical protein
MTDLDGENRAELRSEELTIGELESVSGGRFKTQKDPYQVAREIAQLQQDNPGFV